MVALVYLNKRFRSARDGDAGGKGGDGARAPWATSASGARHPATAAGARGKVMVAVHARVPMVTPEEQPAS